MNKALFLKTGKLFKLLNAVGKQIISRNAVRVKRGISLWNGMWHDLRKGIIMRNVIDAK